MNRSTCLAALTLAVIIAAPAFSQSRRPTPGVLNFASDFQTVPVMSNVTGREGARFQTYVTLLNPTRSSFAVVATLNDSQGVKRESTIQLAAGELKTFTNFLEEVFQYSGGGAVTFQSAESAGGTHNNRFIVNAEIWTASGGRYGTTVPSLEFAGSSSRSFSAPVSIDANTRTNVGCFNQSNALNVVKATVFDKSGTQALFSVDLNLLPNAWGQAPLNTVVTGGYVQFDPTEAAVCYAVVVDNGTNDGHFTSAVEYKP